MKTRTMRNSVLLPMLSAATLISASGALADNNSATACPQASHLDQLSSFRATLAQQLNDGSVPENTIAQQIDQCFPTQVPACLQRARDYAGRYDFASSDLDVTPDQDPHKRPPDELLAPGEQGLKYVFRDDIEQLAKQKGWTVARYKSRHSGGFDFDTPSLLMVYVPGDKVSPPVTFDRWLNFALPKDTGADELNPMPQAKVPGTADYASEVSGTSAVSLPHTFTMVTMERAQNGKPGQVYFQKFYRSEQGKGIFTPEYNSSPSSCYSCHPNGLRAISPLGYHVRAGERQLPPDDWTAVKTINDAMIASAGDANINWRDAVVDPATGKRKTFLNPQAFGPIIGPVEPLNRKTVTDASGNTSVVYPTRTQEFIMGTPATPAVTAATGVTGATGPAAGAGVSGPTGAAAPTGASAPTGVAAATGGAVPAPVAAQPGCWNSRTTVYVTDIFGRPPGANNIYTIDPQMPVDWKKVRNAMRCANCHDNVDRAALNQRTDLAQVDFKILVDQSMPQGLHHDPMESGDPSQPVQDRLNGNERIALANCLRAEFELEKQQLPQWLNETACQ